jgi:hypothetical protein
MRRGVITMAMRPRDAVTAAQLLARVRAFLASATVSVYEKATVLEERFKQAPTQVNLGASCRLIHLGLVEATKTLGTMQVNNADREDLDTCAFAVACEELRQHLLLCRAGLVNVCELLEIKKRTERALIDEKLALAAMISEWDRRLQILHPETLRVLGITRLGQRPTPRKRRLNSLGVVHDLDRWRRAELGSLLRTPTTAPRVPIRTRVACQRVLDEFGIIAKKARCRKHLSVRQVATRTGLSAERIERIEAGCANLSWADIVHLAAVYCVRVSIIARRLKRVFEQFAGGEPSRLRDILPFEWCDAGTDSSKENAGDDLPTFLQLTLAECILDEYAHVVALGRCLQACITDRGGPVVLGVTGPFPEPARTTTARDSDRTMEKDELLARIRSNLGSIADRLKLLAVRHANAPALRFGARRLLIAEGESSVAVSVEVEIKIQHARIARAMDLLPRGKSPRASLDDAISDGPEAPSNPSQSMHGTYEDALNRALVLVLLAGANLSYLSELCTTTV